jgi:hypothetical protein
MRHTIHVPSEELRPCVTIDDFKGEARTLNPLDFMLSTSSVFNRLRILVVSVYHI